MFRMIAFVISDPRNDKNVMRNIPALPVTERDFFLLIENCRKITVDGNDKKCYYR